MIGQRPGDSCDRVEVFVYQASGLAEPATDWMGWEEIGGTGVETAHEAIRQGWDGCGCKGRQAEESDGGFEAGRERGREEGRAMERDAQCAARKSEEERTARQLGKLVADFGMERDRFLGAVEQEVVKLALAVAARILRREAQMDPLLLTGAVRVALGQLAGTTEIRLKVPAAQLELWRDAIGLIPNLPMKPEVAAGEGMRIGDCVIESRVGTVDLGVRSQLGEIERGFFDRAGSGINGEETASARPETQIGARA